MTRARRAALCGALVGALFSTSAHGQARRTAIALVAGSADRVLQARLRAEFGALGWRVRELLPSELVPAQIARRAQALAVLRVARDGSGIELWVAPELNASARSEWIEVDPAHPELAVLQAVESLRARLLELGLAPEDANAATPSAAADPVVSAAASAAPKHAAPGASTRLPANRRDRGWLELALGAAAPGAHVSWTPAFSLSARYIPSSWLAADVSAGLSPFAARVRGAGASADLRSGWLALATELRLQAGPWAFALGAGIAGELVDFRGASRSSELSGRHVSRITALPHARAALELGLTRSLRLRVQSLAGVGAPPIAVVFAGQPVATWGGPLIGFELGFMWAVLR